MMEGATDNRSLERSAGEPMFAEVDMQSLADQSRFVGRAPEQVDRFLWRSSSRSGPATMCSFPTPPSFNV